MASPQLMAGLGAAAAVFFSSMGAATSSAQGGMFLSKSSSAGIWSFAPIVISGVLAIYGLIIGIIIQAQMNNDSLDEADGYCLLSSGIVVGLGCLSSGYGMSRYLEMYMASHTPTPGNQNGTDVSTESSALLGSIHPRNDLPVTWGVIYTMVFLEAIGLYSLIVALFIGSLK